MLIKNVRANSSIYFCTRNTINQHNMSNIQRDAKAAMDTARGLGRNANGSFMEHKTRRERGFNDFELKLPDIKAIPPSDLATNVLSYLGPWNPLPRPISANDTVWLFDNTAFRSAKTNKWEAEFVVAVFDSKTGVEVSTVVADIAEKIGRLDDAAEATIRERLMPFVQGILPGRSVKINFAKQAQLKLGPGGRNGISSDIKNVPENRDGGVVLSRAEAPQGTTGILDMKTAFAEPEGWAVISGLIPTVLKCGDTYAYTNRY